MNKIGSYNKLVISGVIFLLLVPIFSNTGFSTETHQDDGDGWWTDTFQNETYIKTFENCEIPEEGGKITLSKGVIDDEEYDFSKYKTAGHVAFWYEIPIFMCYLRHDLRKFLNGFTFKEYDRIDGNDEKNVTHESYNGVIVHQFRFKLEDTSYITQLDLLWHGKAINYRKVSMYYWQPKYIGNFGKWIEADKHTVSEGTITELQHSIKNITKELFNNSDYLDVCIVVTPLNRMKISSISSNYASLTAYSEGYVPTGYVISESIIPRKISSWEMLTWEDETESKSSIKYQILYANESEIKDEILTGNENGFSKPPIYLTSINASKIGEIKIKAKIERDTENILCSPKIFGWSVAWQTRENTWQDLFNSTLRLNETERESVSIFKGNASLTAYTDWPMFGQNPENTRASDGKGVIDNPEIPWWYSEDDIQVGGSYRNPVIKDEKLYIASLNGTELCVFHNVFERGAKELSEVDRITIPDKLTLQNSPAVTDSNLIISTGSTSFGGIENKVCAFDVINLEFQWDFSYKDKKTGKGEICYYASPTISNGKIFLSSWSGDKSIWDPLSSIFDLSSLTKGNNRLIVLSEENGNQLWEYELPAGSFSSPAVSEDAGRVIVGCQNVKGDSLFALDLNGGGVIWNQTVGHLQLFMTTRFLSLLKSRFLEQFLPMVQRLLP